jgi:polyhydroxybutyrate depolymerase
MTLESFAMRFLFIGLLVAIASWTPVEGAERERSAAIGGGQRTYLLVTPDKQSGPLPLLVVYHGGGDTPRRALRYTRFDRLAKTGEAVVVFPQGLDNNWNDGRVTGDLRQRAASRADDVAFTLAVVEQLAAENVADKGRVFLTGASNGGMMAIRAACDAAEHVAGIAPVAANQPSDWQCKPAQAIPALFFNGTEDDFMPFAGGRIAERMTRKDLGTVDSVDDTIAAFRSIDGCSGVKTSETRDQWEKDQTKAVVVDYECSKAPLRQIVIEGGGHTWPGARSNLVGDMVLGRTTPEIDASAEIWAFFKALPPR